MLELVNQPPEVIPDAAGYVYRNALSVWPFYVFVVLRQTLQAHHRVLPIGVTIIVANIVNVVLNYAWIYGNFGFPAMGVHRLGVGHDREPLADGGDVARARLADAEAVRRATSRRTCSI